MKMKSPGLRSVGAVVVVASVLMAFILLSFVNSLIAQSQASCNCGDDFCGMVPYETPIEVYAGVFALSILFFIGVAFLVKGGSLYKEDGSKKPWAEKLKTLEADEKKIYSLLMEADGTFFQAELVEKTGLSKVKVSRTLDKLEARRLLERRRRGLTNIIVLKNE